MNKFVRCVNDDRFYKGPGSHYPQVGVVYKTIGQDCSYICIEGFSGSWGKDCFVNIQSGYCPCKVKLCIASHVGE